MSALTLCDPELVFIALSLFTPDSSGLLLCFEQVPHRVIMRFLKKKQGDAFFCRMLDSPPTIERYGDFCGALWKKEVENDLQKMSPALL